MQQNNKNAIFLHRPRTDNYQVRRAPERGLRGTCGMPSSSPSPHSLFSPSRYVPVHICFFFFLLYRFRSSRVHMLDGVLHGNNSNWSNTASARVSKRAPSLAVTRRRLWSYDVVSQQQVDFATCARYALSVLGKCVGGRG